MRGTQRYRSSFGKPAMTVDLQGTTTRGLESWGSDGGSWAGTLAKGFCFCPGTFGRYC